MRVALNPFASTIGYLLPYIVSGSIIVSLVLSLPTVGPLLLRALIAQDMFLAGTIVLLLGVLTVIGTLHLRPAADVDRSRASGCRAMSTDEHRPPIAAPDGADAIDAEEQRRGRHPVAADLVALPQAQAGGRSARSS